MLSVHTLERKLKEAGHEAQALARDVISHPQLLAGALVGGPVGVAALAELHKSGELTHLLKRAGLGALTGGGPVMHGVGPKPPHRTPGDHPVNTHDVDKGYCHSDGRKAFPLVGRLVITAGAQTQGTDLGDFHGTAANPTIITTADQIPGNVRTHSARLSIGVKMLTTAGADTLAIIDDLWVIERVNGTEINRWSPADLGCTVDHSGLLTSGACSSQIRIAGAWVDWPRDYDPNVPHALAVQIGRTYTTIQDLDLTFVEAGSRP